LEAIAAATGGERRGAASNSGGGGSMGGDQSLIPNVSPPPTSLAPSHQGSLCSVHNKLQRHGGARRAVVHTGVRACRDRAGLAGCVACGLSVCVMCWEVLHLYLLHFSCLRSVCCTCRL